MDRDTLSRSPSPGFASSRMSDSSADDDDQYHRLNDPSQPVPSLGSLAPPDADGQGDTVECQWEDCSRVFNRLSTLIEHLHNDHIGVHKSNYTCEWTTCPRRGIAQTSRFALISHIRSHTGEKPFVCTKPECDKSFTRSDALAKHMRIQHNIMPPLPGRGGNRKKKRVGEPEVAQPVHTEGYATFKVDQQHPYGDIEEDGLPTAGPSGHLDYYHNSLVNRRSLSPQVIAADSDGEDDIPPHLAALQDPETGLIMGRTPSMVKYILWKAKHEYALQEHASLIEELRALRYEEKCWRERKDALLDEVLRVTFGQQAEELTMPSKMMAEEAHKHKRADRGEPQPMLY
ncbi:hypothetical protein BXZ70DRAFT_920065 [Cristinia sonorae]|uniref:C2H2-type domain-containing protein n=1 Tax=Cristinia sonorae TaxID=1940300 RepID=A0A8K0XT54_9AGAR|nr:hypothetical protein BXZ70DRAFT_920065 [Cristinia sonorae]